MYTRKKKSQDKKTETNTEWLDKVINQLTSKDFSQYLQVVILTQKFNQYSQIEFQLKIYFE